MIAGWFTWSKNPVITVQAYSQLGCMPVSVPNTCLRAFSLKIVPPGSDEWLTVSWGLWPPQGSIQNVVVRDSFKRVVDVHPSRFPAGLFLGGKYRIQHHNGRLDIAPHGKAVADPNLSISFSFAAFFMQLSVPRHAPHIGNTNGLFGFINAPGVARIPQHNLRFFGGHPSNVDVRALCQRCGWAAMQTPAIFEWAATHVVTGPGGKNPPIAAEQGALKQQRYLNAHHQGRRHSFAELSETITQMDHLTADQKASLHAAMEMEFSPNPVGNTAKTFPSVVPKANREDLQYCRLRLKKIFQLDKLKKAQKKSNAKPWWQGKKCLSDLEYAKIKKMIKEKKEKIDKKVALYHESLNACLQDVKVRRPSRTGGGREREKRDMHVSHWTIIDMAARCPMGCSFSFSSFCFKFPTLLPLSPRPWLSL